MDARHLDNLARDIGTQLPRRGVLGALGGLAALLTAPSLDAAAKRKKKKCKGGKRKCGQTCIPADQCCTTADCGARDNCVGGACVCPAGQKACNGSCVPQAACCQNGECSPMQTCTNGVCTCLGDLTTCGLECIEPGIGTCCGNGDCPAGQSCDAYACWCNAAEGVWCGAECCDGGNDEICETDSAGSTCVGGGCQLLDWCNVDEDSVCRDDPDHYCVCITAFEPLGVEVPACVDGDLIGESCDSCDDSDDCDAGYACVQGNLNAEGFCGCSGTFCAALCDAGPERVPQRERARAGNAARKEKPGRARERR